MRDWIKFYSKNDGSIGIELKRVVPVLDELDRRADSDDINEIIELYNIKQLLETVDESDPIYGSYKKYENRLISIVYSFFNGIENDSFFKEVGRVNIYYREDFWKLFEETKLYNKISSELIFNIINKNKDWLFLILKNKNTSKYYGKEISECMRIYRESARIIAACFLEKKSEKYYIPKELEPDEFEGILEKYIQQEDAYVNVLQLIIYAPNYSNCPISDALKLKAKKRLDEIFENNKNNNQVYSHSISVSLKKQSRLIEKEQKGGNFSISYDVTWFEDNLDFPTILNNFKFVFQMFDYSCKSALPSAQKNIGALEDLFIVDGVKFYKCGEAFYAEEFLSHAQTELYCNFLKQHGIDIEDVFKWFFEVYLKEELSINGFSYNASYRYSTILEKIRNLISEMDGILKKYNMYVIDGAINQELFQMSSEHLFYSDVLSLISPKYVYACSESISNQMKALFSDQTLFAYIPKFGKEYSCLYELIRGKRIKKEDLEYYHISTIDWLIEKKDLFINSENVIELYYPKVIILKELYDNEVSSIYKYSTINSYYDILEKQNDICIGNTLFSKPEQDYLDYKMNRSKFSNGEDLRNKYSHGSNSGDLKQHQHDYIELIKIMIMIIVKIDDELRYIDDESI